MATQKIWEANEPAELDTILKALEGVQSKFNSESSQSKVLMADLIVLGSQGNRQGCCWGDPDLSMTSRPIAPTSSALQPALTVPTDIAQFAINDRITFSSVSFAKFRYMSL